MSREFWWNADFDLALQPGREAALEPALALQVRQLGQHALLAASPGDSVLLAEAPPQEFLAHLEHHDLEPPKISVLPSVRTEAAFTPYGWSPQAIALKGRYDHPAASPPFEIIRRVNGRGFGHDLERELFDSTTPRGGFSSVEELRSLLEAEGNRSHGWITKTVHGNAALGNRRIRDRDLTPSDLSWLERNLEKGDMVLERWLPREMDLCAVFEVGSNGVITQPNLHETIHTAAGSFIGALFDNDNSVLRPWREAQIAAAHKVGFALAETGYFGSACVDALVHQGDDDLHLRPLVEINARRHVSEGWARLAREWGGCVYGRFFSSRKLRLPDSYEEFRRLLGADAWDGRKRTGVLLTSPLSIESSDGRRRPGKLGVLFRGSSRGEVMGMERAFRKRFER